MTTIFRMQNRPGQCPYDDDLDAVRHHIDSLAEQRLSSPLGDSEEELYRTLCTREVLLLQEAS